MLGDTEEQKRWKETPWRGWYNLAIWKKDLQPRQLEKEPFCEMCRQLGRVKAATVADHIVPHRGDWKLFTKGKLQSLCATCHNTEKQSEEKLGYSKALGLDGLPLDPKHPAYAD